MYISSVETCHFVSVIWIPVLQKWLYFNSKNLFREELLELAANWSVSASTQFVWPHCLQVPRTATGLSNLNWFILLDIVPTASWYQDTKTETYDLLILYLMFIHFLTSLLYSQVQAKLTYKHILSKQNCSIQISPVYLKWTNTKTRMTSKASSLRNKTVI